MTKKSAEQKKVEMDRTITAVKLQLVPFLKTLDRDFFFRLTCFVGVAVLLIRQTRQTEEGKVVCKQEGPESPVRFSKTFGQEKKLDVALLAMKQEQIEKDAQK